ncbi:MAG: divergent polysaccharide deacetylase family protein [Ignavibacteriae bacterium]|nr:divergent polysaccharide deacetylase family protein [Ignavibacteriota bacterium]
MDLFGERFDDEGEDLGPQPEASERRLRGGVRRRLWLIALLAGIGILCYVGEKYAVLVQPSIEKLRASRDLQSVKSVEEEVRSILENYGITDSWVRKRSVGLEGIDSVRDVWTVSIPGDVPVASVTHDLSVLAERYQGRAYAVEDAKTRQVYVHIKFRDMVRYTLVFQPTAGIRRREGSIALLVDGLEDCDESELEAFMASRDPVGCIIIPGRSSGPLYEQVRVRNKDIVLHLHVFATRQEVNRLAFSDDLRESEMRWKVRNIVKGYQASGYFFMTSERALGSNARFVQTEFENQGFQMVDAASLFFIDRTSELSNMTSRMNDLAASAMRNGTAIGVVKLEESTMSFLHDEMVRLRKKGLDFTSMRSLLAHRK